MTVWEELLDDIALDSSLLSLLRMTAWEELLDDIALDSSLLSLLRMTFVGELFESDEHAKSKALAAVTIISDAAVFWNTL